MWWVDIKIYLCFHTINISNKITNTEFVSMCVCAYTCISVYVGFHACEWVYIMGILMSVNFSVYILWISFLCVNIFFYVILKFLYIFNSGNPRFSIFFVTLKENGSASVVHILINLLAIFAPECNFAFGTSACTLIKTGTFMKWWNVKMKRHSTITMTGILYTVKTQIIINIQHLV